MQDQPLSVRLPALSASRAASRVSIRRLAPLGLLWLLLALAIAAVYWTPQAIALDVGHSYARPHLHGFFADEAQAESTYAYSGASSRIVLPGLGGSAVVWQARFNGWRPPGVAPAEVTFRSGENSLTFAPATTPRTYAIFLPAGAGDVGVDIVSNAYRPAAGDDRWLGVPVEAVRAQALGRAPAWTTLLLTLGLGTLLWAFGRRVGLGPWLALGAALALCAPLVAGLALARMFITVGLLRWVVVAALLHAALGPLQWLVGRTLRRHELAVAPLTWNWLWGLFGLAFLFKLGGVLYPHIIVFDEAAHTGRVKLVLAGEFARLYFPDFTSFMGVTVGIEGGYFPYSPLWYLVVTPLHWLGVSIGDAMNGLNAFLDITKGLIIFVIALATTGRERLAVLAALLYQLLPMPYYLLSWGNYPTQFGLWAALLATAYLALNYGRLRERRVFGWWVGLLVLCILTYTVIGVFAWTMFGLLALIEALRGSRRPRGLALALIGGILAAELIAFAVYHVQFAGVFFSETLPSLLSSADSKVDGPLTTAVDPRESPLSNFSANTSFMRNHLTDWLILLALAGTVGLYADRATRRWWPLWTAWLGIFVLYSLASAFVADMVLKHIFFIMPLICIAVAWVAEQVWTRLRGGRWAVAAGLLALGVVVGRGWHFYLLIKRH